MRLIEIGPLAAPIAAKCDGWHVCIVDRASREELVEEFHYLGEARARIEPVDVVWRGGPLHEAFPKADLGTYDAIICSHVLEHLPDPIAFLKSAGELLAPNGELFLLLPDKRFTFDYFRPVTMTGDLFDAHRMKVQNHEHRTAFNQIAYSVLNEGLVSWHFGRTKDLTFVSTLEVAMLRAEVHAGPAGQPNVDFHAWCFVPSSLDLIVLELQHLDLVDFGVERTSRARGGEFFRSLRKGARHGLDRPAFERLRRDLLCRIVDETAMQIRLARAGGLLGRYRRGLVPDYAIVAWDLVAHYARVKLAPLFRVAPF